MKFAFSATLLLASFTFLAGCNSLGGIPEFAGAGISPTALHPGDTALVTIDVKDKNDIVAGIVGVIDNVPKWKLTLNDDGQEGDVKAGDGTWSLAVQVPLKAPPGNFNLIFTAYRSDGVAVPIRGNGGAIESLTVHVPLTVTPKQ